MEEHKKQFDQEIESIEKDISNKYEIEDDDQFEKHKNEEKNPYEQLEEQLELELSESNLKSRIERRKEYVQKQSELQEKKQRNWLCRRGKGYLLDFQDDQIKQLKECFNSLDTIGNGSIGIDQLEEPLIGLGFAENRDEVQEMVDLVDEDGSGMIEFPEFLSIIKNADGSSKTAKINKFFKDMTSGQLSTNDLSFNLLVQKLRREYLMNAIMSSDLDKKQFGEKILRNVGKQLQAQKFKSKKFDLSSPKNTE